MMEKFVTVKRRNTFVNYEKPANSTDNLIYKQHIQNAVDNKLISVSHINISKVNNIQYITIYAFYKSNYLIKCRNRFRVSRRYGRLKLKKLFKRHKRSLKNKKAKLRNIRTKNRLNRILTSPTLRRNKRIARKNLARKSVKRKTLLKAFSPRLRARKLAISKPKSEIKTEKKKNKKKKNKKIPLANKLVLNSKLLGLKGINTQLRFKIKPLNRVRHSHLAYCYERFQRSRRFIFPAGHRIYYDFVKMTALMIGKRISLSAYLEIINGSFRFIDKRKHNAFIRLLKQISKVLIKAPDSDICGVKFVLNGKIRGKTRSKTSKISNGQLHRTSAHYQIAYAKTAINTKYGVFGLTA